MIKQTDYTENMNIYNKGCLFASLLNISELITGEELSHDKVLFIYDHVIKRGYMDENCFIYNHEAIINEGLSFLIHPEIRAKYVGAQYVNNNKKKSWGKNDGEYIIIQVRTEHEHSHFRLINIDPYEPSPEFHSILSVRYYDIKG